jgi:phosphatidylserine/phosphatidylglycerophosphate/cardiolipin synthase-like enzyme
MDELVEYLQRSIADEVFSKDEKRTLKSMVHERLLDANQLNFLRGKVFELANAKITPTNYPFVMAWIKAATSALVPSTTSTTDVFFSPGDACRNTIIQRIDSSIKLLQICVFTISDDSITKSLLGAHRRKVQIKVITDNDKSLDQGSDIDQLARAGIAVKMDITSNHMHHKFMIADMHTLITGSYNWTLSAARYNHENILLTRESNVIKSFSSEFDKLWNEMKKID